MGFLTNMINSGGSGDIIIEMPNQNKPEYPKGIQLVIDYHTSLGVESYGFYPRCSVDQVFNQSQIEELRKSICPKCNHLSWDGTKLVPIYKYFGIPAAQVLQGKYSQCSFPLEYAEYDHLDYIYFPTYSNGAKDLLTQYANQQARVKIAIENAIEKLNVDNVLYKEFKIYRELMMNFFDYSKDSLGELKVEKYIELRTKVLSRHSQLKY